MRLNLLNSRRMWRMWLLNCIWINADGRHYNLLLQMRLLLSYWRCSEEGLIIMTLLFVSLGGVSSISAISIQVILLSFTMLFPGVRKGYHTHPLNVEEGNNWQEQVCQPEMLLCFHTSEKAWRATCSFDGW